MTTLTVTAKGQITLKKDLLRHLAVEPGQQVEVVALPDGRVEIRPSQTPRNKPISAFFGRFKREGGSHFTIEEIDDAIADAWAGKRRR